MKKLQLISLIFLLLLASGCTVQNEDVKDLQTPKIAEENKNTKEDNQTKENSDAENQEESTDQTAKTEEENTANFERIDVKLVRPIDGDTIEVLINGKSESVRFLLIDTPETSHPRLGKQPFGEEAKAFTAKMVENAKSLELEFDIGPKHDKYSRLLAYVYVDGKMLQEELLKRGFTRVAYVYPPSTRYVDQFRALQEKSQQEGVGIWSVENYAQQDGFHPEVIDNGDTNNTNECLVKGNINSSGEKIYHVPEGAYYEVTKPEKCFDTEIEAEADGFRKSKR
jgi:micrococcal nuclease